MRVRVMGIAVGMVVLAAIVVVVLTTTGARACSKIGCGSQATFSVESLDAGVRSQAARFRLCLDGRCEMTRLADPNATFGVWGRLEGTTVASGSLEVEDASGAVVVRYELAGPVDADLWLPNGEGCEPTCPQLPLVVVGGELRKASG